VRECLFGPDRPVFSGCVAWRGIVPMHCVAPDASEMIVTTWLGPRGHVLQYPVRRGELMNFISFVERDDWQIEAWTEEGTTSELAHDFHGWHPDVHAVIRNIGTPFKWALMVRGPMERWSKGRITLLGDACHPTLPFLGQGGVMAIEDGYILAACLQKYFNDPTVAFARYEELRKDRTAAWCGNRTRIDARHSARRSPIRTRWQYRLPGSGSRRMCASVSTGFTPMTPPRSRSDSAVSVTEF
jgi:salicylate hydroxylase